MSFSSHQPLLKSVAHTVFYYQRRPGGPPAHLQPYDAVDANKPFKIESDDMYGTKRAVIEIIIYLVEAPSKQACYSSSAAFE